MDLKRNKKVPAHMNQDFLMKAMHFSGTRRNGSLL